MRISKRSRLSLCQFLPILGRQQITILFEKYGISTDEVAGGWHHLSLEEAIVNAIREASDAQVTEILQELARTGRAVRSKISPKVLYDEPWADLELCLQLDNIVGAKDEYGQALGRFVPIEPAIGGVQTVDDDLTSELKRSGLTGVDGVLSMIEESATEFKAGNKNACLNAARVALQTLARGIAVRRRLTHAGSFDDDKWGQVMAYLRKSGFIDKNEEDGLTGVYTFVSPGSHVPLGLSDLEFARLGRTLAFSACYFLIKAANATEGE
ncbi:MAG: hypothetical protein CME90_20525 [Hoeflea sp.]|nr:hypothetical protein [Hoeflea sp.]|tara:strand:+ start:2244 stop:3047 length:804 start_codon:yes stop_codon:yes gene_type:complete